MLPKPLNQTVSQQEIDQGEARKRQRGTGFTNIGRILGANIGAGQKMGESIGTQLGQQAEQVRKGIEAGQSQFKAGMQESAKKEQEKVEKAETALTGIKQMQQPQAQTIQQPVDYEAIGMGLRGAEYTGPKGIKNIQEQQQRAMNLAALGRLSGMAGGQQELLRSQVAGRGRYGLGQSALDAMLLGREGQRQLEAARSTTGALASQAQQSETMAQEQARAAESSIEAGKLAALEKIQKNITSTEQTGKESAISYLRTGENLKSGLEKISKGKQKDLTEEEKLALPKASEYGIDTSVKIDPRDLSNLQNMLSNIASKGETVYTGQKLYTDPQKIALQQLSSLYGSSIPKDESLKFEKDLFKQGQEEIKGYESYKDMLKKQKEMLERGIYKKVYGDAGLSASEIKRLTEGYKKTSKEIKAFFDAARKAGYPISETDEIRINRGKGLDEIIGNPKAYMEQIARYQKELEKEKAAQASGGTIQDYLNKILGAK